MKRSVMPFGTVKIFIILGFLVFYGASIVSAAQNEITDGAVIAAQKAWSDAVVDLGRKYMDGKDYKKAAEDLVDDLYAYQTGEVLFKPTKAADIKFRMTNEGAIKK